MKLINKLFLMFIIAFLLVSTAMAGIVFINEAEVSASSETTYFYVDPPEVKDIMPGENFTIKINVTEAPPTYAWYIRLSWDPDLLELVPIWDPYKERWVNVTEGDFLDRRYWDPFWEDWVYNYTTSFVYVPLDEANENGSIMIGCSLLGDLPEEEWAIGDGWLSTLNFLVEAEGSSVLNIYKTRLADHLEWDPTIGRYYPAYTHYLNLDGFFFNQPFHDIAITNVTVHPTLVKAGETVAINVTVANEGNYSETFDVAIYADTIVYNTTVDWWPDEIVIGDEITVGTQTVTEPLAPGANRTLTFTWNTTGVVAPDTYTISANATLTSPTDDDTRDNLFIDGTVTIVLVHDIAVTNVTCDPAIVTVGEVVYINVTVTNKGMFEEAFNVTVYYDDIRIKGAKWTSITLDAGANTTLEGEWNTSVTSGGIFTITAEATLESEMFPDDNTLEFDRKVTVYRPPGWPVANFTYTPENPLVNHEVTFTSTSWDEDGYITSWDWDFNGDDVIDATTENATWTYTKAGRHKVTLIVNDNDTLTPPMRTEDIVLITAPPVANFTYSPGKPLVGAPVTFDATGSYATPPLDPEDVVTYKWDFDDGNITEHDDPIITHVYETSGSYLVNLTVTDGATHSHSIWEPLTVYAPPVANFTYSPIDPMKNELVTFDASTSYDEDGEIVSYKWDFNGDGIFDTPSLADPIATYIYTENPDSADQYVVTLKVTDDDELSGTLEYKYVTVLVPYDIAVTNITLSSNTAAIGDILSIDVTAKNEGYEPVVEANSFQVTVYYNDTEIGTHSVIDLDSKSSVTLNFSWDTTNVDAGLYSVKAIAKSGKREINTTNNEFIGGSVTIKTTSTISIFVYPENITLGESVTINGTITPTHKDVNVKIHYKLSGETDWNTTTVKTDATTGWYELSWTPLNVGTYEVKASWPGDENTLAAESDIKTVTVEEVSAPAYGIQLYVLAAAAIIIAAAILIYIVKIRKPTQQP